MLKHGNFKRLMCEKKAHKRLLLHDTWIFRRNIGIIRIAGVIVNEN